MPRCRGDLGARAQAERRLQLTNFRNREHLHGRMLLSDGSMPFEPSLMGFAASCNKQHLEAKKSWKLSSGQVNVFHDPGTTTLVALLKECARTGDLARGRQVYDRIVGAGVRSTVLENSLLRMYCNCGSLEEAVHVFAEIACRNVFSWNILFSAVAARGHLDQAREMLSLFPEFDTVSQNIWLAACARSGALSEACDCFQIIPEKDNVSWNTFLAALAANGHLDNAKDTFDTMPQKNLLSWNTMLVPVDGSDQQWLNNLEEIFERMPQRCIVSWTAMVSCYAQHGHIQSSWSLFLAMPERSIAAVNSSMQAFIRAGFCDETVTMIFGRMPEWNSASFNLKLGAAARDIAEPRTLLDSIPERNIASWTSLLTAFSKNFAGQKSVDNAEMVFSKMPQWDGLSCNAMAHLYSEADDLTSAAKIFDTNLQRDAVSWNSLITSCGRLIGGFDITRDVFQKMPLHSIVSFTAMLLGFARSSGDDDDDNAWNWFKSLPCQDIVSWNAMIFAAAGSTQSLLLLRRMELEGFKPTYVTFATIVDSFADSAALADGRAIHRRVLQLGFFPGNIVIGNALINFYSRCGSIDEALEVFQRMRRRDLITWSSIVAGYAWNGFGERSAQIFHSMLLEGFDPNSVTLVNILASCSHGGLLDFGRIMFVFVTADVPGVAACREHYDCLVDLLGRSGRLEEARELMESMPFEPSLMGRMSFAASCNKQHLEQD